MRKVYSFLALALTFLAGAFNASAQYYTAVGFDDLARLTDITPGQKVVLQTASAGEPDFFCVTKKVSTVKEDAIFMFEEAGDMDGFMTYRLKQASSGQYLTTSQTLVSSPVRAFRFFAKHPEAFYFRGEDTVPLDCDPTVIASYDDTHYNGVEPSAYEAFVFTDVEHATSDGWNPASEESQTGGREDEAPWSYLAANWGGQAPFFGPWSDTNTWYLFEVAEKAGYDLLEAAVQDLCPSGDPTTTFKAGNGVGQIPESYVNAWIEKANAAIELVNAMSEDQAACQRAAEEMIAAYKACQENVVQMTGGGYFRMRVHEVEGNSSYPEGSYIFGADAKVQWVAGDYEVPESNLEVADAQYIWHLEADPEVENGYKIRNLAENQYVGYVGSVSTVLPLVAEADQTYVITAHPNVDGAFNLIPTQNTSRAMHGQVNGHVMVFWTTDAGASAIVFEGVEQTVIDEVTGLLEEYWAELKKQQDIKAMQELVDKVELAYNRGFAYKPDCSLDGFYDEQGLVPSHEYLWTNAQETSEGPIENAMDGDPTTFWHTAWSSRPANLADGEFHNLCADLGEAVNGVAVKLTQRWSGQNNAPKQVRAFAANEATDFDEEGEPIYDWVEQGVFQFEYLYDTEWDGTTKTKWTGVNSIPFNGNYRYLRLDFEKNINNANNSYNLSEIRFYRTVLDQDLSRIQGVPAEIVAELLKQKETAKNEILDEAPTAATYDALQAAYDNFIANYPDPDKLQELLDEAKEQHDAAEELDELGYFQDGAKAALYSVIEEVEGTIKDVMTNDEIKSGETKLEKAIADFFGKLNTPVDGTYYRIRNAATVQTAAQSAYLLAGGNGNSRVIWGGANDANMTLELGYIWKCIKNEDGSFNFQNALTGNYMGTTQQLSSMPIYMSDTLVSIRLESAKVPGQFVLRQGDSNAYANTSPQGYMVTYYDYDENSRFTFIPEANDAWLGEEYIALSDDYVHPFTLAFSVDAADVPLYKVLGVKDNLTLELVETKDIEAGVPFLARRSEAGSLSLYPTATDVTNFVYVNEPKTENGLVGTLGGVELESVEGIGVFYNDLVLMAEKNETSFGANSAYLKLSEIPETNLTGDVSLELDGEVYTYLVNYRVGVNDLTIARPAQNVVFDLSGRRVLNAKKGLYIINGKKVLVK
ncbi:MAG: discoidin domain-containing protein [Alloprevotella sp.]|nr:discoidin domain-containing protein [Alloprevotella sp.]